MVTRALSTSCAMPTNADRARAHARGSDGLEVGRGARASRGLLGSDEGWEGETMVGSREGEVGGELFAVVAPQI